MNSRFWKFFASLRLTVVCLALGLVLVFLGTLAQVHEGLFLAQDRWFRAFFVLRQGGDPWWVPPIYPGGYLIGVTLLVNLLVAQTKRFQWSKKKFGIHLTHFGIVLLLVGQLVTDMLSEESHMSFNEGETRSFSESHQDNELVFTTDAAAGQEEVVSIPESTVARGGEIAHSKLPFTLRVKEYHINGEVLSHAAVTEAAGKLTTALATVEGQFATVDGLVPQAERAQESEGRAAVWRAALKAIGETDTGDLVAAAGRVAAQPEREGKLREELKTRFQREMIERFSAQNAEMRYAAQKLAKKEAVDADALPPAASSGAGQRASAFPQPETRASDSKNFPYAIVEVVPKSGASLGTWLVSPWLHPQEIAVEGKTVRAQFRPVRIYHPFAVTLLKTTHEVYRGTTIPKNYQSRVRLNNPQTGEAREVDIYMNNPLRYAGLTFYQSQMDKFSLPGFSGLQVVRNPGWITPYLGCILVGGGMVYQFLFHLIGFISKRRAPVAVPAKSGGARKKPSAAKERDLASHG